ncbi:DUF2141 domain-containing protein [Alteromonas sp. a30]|uniref:DUF2141 domain-containing protein n=1 Tax=Alteromonas sp. a30 TaxID=2730917 RepID=UPI00227E7046|nr:DUF2141 domain-containing protein [Alteromonas sp. a30]MCY7294744.1 DUF2141 domain-containing protein [Alteromonas sp. a30]
MNVFRILGLAAILALVGCGEDKTTEYSGTYDLKIVATDINSSGGFVRGVLCTEKEDFPNQCAIAKDVEASAGQVVWEFIGVPAGEYAFAAYHDENNDNKINFVDGRMPSEGLMFSNNSMGRAGPPSFKQSAFKLVKNTKMVVQAKYFSQNGG